MEERHEQAIRYFQEYLRFATVSVEAAGNGVYDECADWLSNYVKHAGLSPQVFSPINGKPIVLASWIGQHPELPCILLNSHYDVVPVMKEHWEHDPFKGILLDSGEIIGRGTQDMKSVGIQYVEAIRELRLAGFQPHRSVHLLFVPDEEIGGADGMEKFLSSSEFQSIQPVGVAFDEGLANPNDVYTVFYGERTVWWLLVNANGPTGHGSRFIKKTAMEKLMSVCNKAFEFRNEEEKKLSVDNGCSHSDMKKKKLGDVCTINLTMLNGGVTQNSGKTYELNVIPTHVQAGFDVRISPNVCLDSFTRKLDEWCQDDGVSWSFADWVNPLKEHFTTSIDRQENPWWGIFTDCLEKLDLTIEPEVFPAGTDSCFIRRLGIPAFGFSPMKNTEILLHEHNEKLHQDVFIEGIQVYVALLKELLSTPALSKEL